MKRWRTTNGQSRCCRRQKAREQDGEEQALIPDRTLYPLNSRRLRTVHLQLLAQTLGLPTTNISTEEVRQLIDGALLGRKREPRNCQVVVQERRETVSCIRLFLLDQTGVFHQSTPSYIPLPEGEEAKPELSELQRLQTQLQEMSERLHKAEERWHKAQEMLRREKETSQRLWEQNCEKLEELDAALADKEDHLAELRTRLTQPQVTEQLAELRTRLTHPQTTHTAPIAPHASLSFSLYVFSLSPSDYSTTRRRFRTAESTCIP